MNQVKETITCLIDEYEEDFILATAVGQLTFHKVMFSDVVLTYDEEETPYLELYDATYVGFKNAGEDIQKYMQSILDKYFVGGFNIEDLGGDAYALKLN